VLVGCVQSGRLLLTPFVKFLIHCYDRKTVGILQQHHDVVCALLARPPMSAMRNHPEERMVLTEFMPRFIYDALVKEKYAFEWMKALIKRGADVNAIGFSNQTTPLQHWCYDCTSSAAGLLLLLEAGADLNAPQVVGNTAVYLLCEHFKLDVLRELAAAGWLEVADLDQPGWEGELPLDYLRQALSKEKNGRNQEKNRSVIELLETQKARWQTHARPTLLRELTAHAQLIPDIAETIVAYIDGRKQNAASAPASSSASASASISPPLANASADNFAATAVADSPAASAAAAASN
jgi:hypothetical protein